MALKLRRGTDAERQNIVFAEGEPVYVTDTGELYVGDGVTEGGKRIRSGLSAETDPSLGGDLDLAGNNIVGTGNIAIDGNITATGTINLGDNIQDNITVAGQIASSLIPNISNIYNLGSESKTWESSHINNVFADNLFLSSLYSSDSSLVFDSSTDTFFGNFEGSFTGDIDVDFTQIDSNINPNTNLNYNLGTPSQRWNFAYVENIDVSEISTGTITSNEILTNALKNSEGNVVYEGFSQSLFVNDIIVNNNAIFNSEVLINGNTSTDSIETSQINTNLLNADNVTLTNIINPDSTTLYDGVNQSLFVKNITVDTTATFGRINAATGATLGQGPEDGIALNGNISTDIIPQLSNAFSIGNDFLMWQNAHIGSVFSENIITENIWKEDSSILYDGINDSLTINNITARTLSSPINDNVLNLQSREYYGNIIARDGTEAFNYAFKGFRGTFEGTLLGNVISNNFINANEIRSVSFDTIKFQHAMRFPNYTSEERATLPQEPGLVIYNGSTGKFQGYVEDTGDSTPGWIDLH